MVWGKAGSTTTTGNVGNIDVNSMTASNFNTILYHVIGNGGTANTEFRVSSDSGTNYASRESGNGGADGTHVNDTGLPQAQFGANTEFVVTYMCNISGEEKLFLKWTVDQGTAGAGNFPYRRELAGKHITTAGQITDVEYYDNGGGTTIATDSNLSVLGSDLTPAAAVTFPSDVPDYTRFEETDTRKMYTKGVYGWVEKGTGFSKRGVFAGGQTNGGAQNTMDYITIDTLGNATDFGDLVAGRRNAGTGVSSTTRGLIGGGNSGSHTNVIEYITFAIIGNATDFGDLSVSRDTLTGASSITRGVWAGGQVGSTTQNVIDYVTIATTGNASDFGDLTVARSDLPAGVDNKSRGCFGGGYSGGNVNVIDYITISTTGNATDFGDLTVSRRSLGGTSNNTRGIFASGWASTYSDVMDYITISTLGNATDFGNLTVAKYGVAGVANTTRGVFGGDYQSSGGYVNNIDYITIDTTGNATDFGDLTLARALAAGMDDY